MTRGLLSISLYNKDTYYEKNEFGAYVRPLQPKQTRMVVVLYPNSLHSHDRTPVILHCSSREQYRLIRERLGVFPSPALDANGLMLLTFSSCRQSATLASPPALLDKIGKVIQALSVARIQARSFRLEGSTRDFCCVGARLAIASS